MGRELKRVPLDFDHPQGEIWPGYLNPYHDLKKQCPLCSGTGQTLLSQALSAVWYNHSRNEALPLAMQAEPSEGRDRVIEFIKSVPRGHFEAWCYNIDQDDVQALWNNNRLWDFRPRDKRAGEWPAPDALAVNEWSRRGIGHDSINQSVCVKARCERYGVVHYCPNCEGDGYLWPSNAVKTLCYDLWTRIDPPTGEGWQVWENVTEGSPISPVFATRDELIGWLLNQGYSEGAAEQFAEQGWAFSMVMGNGKMYNNIESLNMAQDED